MKRRLLSLLLMLCMVLGILTVDAFATEPPAGEVPSVSAYVSLSYDDQYVVAAETGKVMALVPVTVPYFDLANYGLEEYYFNTESYGDDGDGLPGSDLLPGSAEFAYGKVTVLHLYIYITEVYYCGIDPENAGQGYLYESGLLKSGNGTGEDCLLFVSGGAGSLFMSKFWEGDCNLNYYVNYQYPEASPGWGATADQMLLREGDIVTLGNFSSYDFYFDSASIFNFITAEENTVTQGEELTLTVMRAGANMGETLGMTAHTPVNDLGSPIEVFYCPVNDIPSANVWDWNSLGEVDEDAKLSLNTADLAPGQYIIAVPGQHGIWVDGICSTPGGMLLTVEAAEVEEPKSMLGDLNGDGKVDVTDVVLLAQHLAKFDVIINETAADINGGGIQLDDLVLLKQYLAKMAIEYPIGQPIDSK